MNDVIILGAGPAGLTLALSLHAAGIPCQVYEQAAEIRAVGVGVNLLPLDFCSPERMLDPGPHRRHRACTHSGACLDVGPRFAHVTNGHQYKTQRREVVNESRTIARVVSEETEVAQHQSTNEQQHHCTENER